MPAARIAAEASESCWGWDSDTRALVHLRAWNTDRTCESAISNRHREDEATTHTIRSESDNKHLSFIHLSNMLNYAPPPCAVQTAAAAHLSPLHCPHGFYAGKFLAGRKCSSGGKRINADLMLDYLQISNTAWLQDSSLSRVIREHHVITLLWIMLLFFTLHMWQTCCNQSSYSKPYSVFGAVISRVN